MRWRIKHYAKIDETEKDKRFEKKTTHFTLFSSSSKTENTQNITFLIHTTTPKESGQKKTLVQRG